MSPRPKKASDEEVYAAVYRVMSRVGPAQLTLAAIAAEAGVTAAALVQRFGSRRGLLLRVWELAGDSTGQMFAQLRATHASPLDVVRAWADCFAQMSESPGGLAQHLAYLQIDLTDPDFHRHVLKQARATRKELRSLLSAAVASGELVEGVDTGRLARTVEAMVSGSLMSWAFYREGSASKWVRQDLDAVLRPYLRVKRTRGATRSRGGVSTPRH